MGLKIFRVFFSNLKLFSTFFAAGAVFCTASAAYAGFEWVPEKPKSTPEPAIERTLLLPPLGVETPQIKTLPVIEEPVQPMGATSLTPLQPESEPVINVKSMTPEPATMAGKARSPHYPAATMTKKNFQSTLSEKDMTASVPPTTRQSVVKQRVFMSDDAPESARQNMRSADVLSIHSVAEKPNQPENLERPLPGLPALPEFTGTNKAIDGAADGSKNMPGQHAVGFGKDIPLALALQHIAPAGYAFSFDEGINPGTKVSWNGGKVWVEVMRDAIAPLGLHSTIHGKSVFIQYKKQSNFISAPVSIGPAAGEITKASSDIIVHTPDRSEVVRNLGKSSDTQPVNSIDAMIEEHVLKISDKDTGSESENDVWQARKGESLKDTLTGWSKQGSFELEWHASHDYLLAIDVVVAGQVDSALQALIKAGMNKADQPKVTFLKSPEHMKILKLIIEDQLISDDPSAS